MWKKTQKFLCEKGYSNIRCTDSYIAAEGDAPICLIGYIDDSIIEKPITFYKAGDELWSAQSLGKYCQASLAAIMEIIEGTSPLNKPSVIILKYTETFQRYDIFDKFRKDFPECPFESKLILKISGDGKKNASFFGIKDKEIKKLIDSYGFDLDKNIYKFDSLSVFWDIPIFELSIGLSYRKVGNRILNIRYLKRTIKKVQEMVKDSYNWKDFKFLEK